jgi:hypothetical protein
VSASAFYAYVGNDPTDRTDPSGLCGEGKRVDGCLVTAKLPANPKSGTPELNPSDAAAINSHAIAGDGSSRQADFRNVSLADLGKSLQKLAGQKGSALSNAIAAANGDKSKLAGIHMTGVKAGGGFDGNTGDQKGGIGRFSVQIDGTVSIDKNGGWHMQALVTGEIDRQDYPADSGRTGMASAGTWAFRQLQAIDGGKDYDMSFHGGQIIDVVPK